MILHTISVKPLNKQCIDVEFNNGVNGVIDLSQELWGEMFEPLKDPALFLTAHQDPLLGTVVWNNGADFAPEFLLDLLKKQTGIS